MINNKHNYIIDFFERLKNKEVFEIERIEFIDSVTNGYDPQKLQALLFDVKKLISDEVWEAEEKNDEIIRNTNDEYYLFRKYHLKPTKEQTEKALQELKTITAETDEEYEYKYDDWVLNNMEYASYIEDKPNEAFYQPRLSDLLRLKSEIEYHLENKTQSMVSNDNTEISKNEGPDHLDNIDGTAKSCIKSFLRSKSLSDDRLIEAEHFLRTFEIMATESSLQSLMKNVTKTIKDIPDHKSFHGDKDSLPGDRQLRNWLNEYWDEHRNPDG